MKPPDKKYTPGKVNMEPENGHVVEENHFPRASFQVPC
jgi:hypothetical protein